ncbi:nuclear transport factor 2 family protein [Streptomyces glaucescens]|uniref:nuclear transport factor 2 family protein n=1 Tax=Streptomyces glaucescens TaxID=1907 RepID=UPI000A366D84|nr:nuclear transport factor 2 family protein [Streptomyces glaucescens]
MSSPEDRLDVIETCTRMLWYVDLRQWDALPALLAEKVTLDYTSLFGGEPIVRTPDQVIADWSAGLGHLKATQHMIGNQIAEVRGDAAVLTAHFQATHLLPNPYGSETWTLGGRYRFDLARTTAGWRIAGVLMTALWADGNQQIMTVSDGPKETT